MQLLTTVLPPVPSGQAPGRGLHGRRGEREMLDQLAADVRAGQSRVLVQHAHLATRPRNCVRPRQGEAARPDE